MAKNVGRFAGPAIVFLLGAGLEFSSIEDDRISIGLWSLAGLWGLAALLTWNPVTSLFGRFPFRVVKRGYIGRLSEEDRELLAQVDQFFRQRGEWTFMEAQLILAALVEACWVQPPIREVGIALYLHVLMPATLARHRLDAALKAASDDREVQTAFGEFFWRYAEVDLWIQRAQKLARLPDEQTSNYEKWKPENRRFRMMVAHLSGLPGMEVAKDIVNRSGFWELDYRKMR